MYSEDFAAYNQHLKKRRITGFLYQSLYLYPRLRWQLKGLALDVGCGLGAFARSRPNTHACDINPININELKSQGVPAGLFRSAGLLESPIHYSYVAGIQACFLLSYLLRSDKKLNPKLFNLALAVFSLLMISLITSYTRGAWLGIAVTILVMGYMVSPRLGLKLTAGGLALITVATLISTRFRERLFSLFDSNFASNTDRLFLWKINWEMFKDHPILGIGYLQTETRAGEYATRLGRPDAYLSHAHNIYLEMLSSTGLVGLTVYLALVTYMFWLTVKVYQAVPRDRSWWKIIVFGSLAAQIFLHIGGLTEVTFRAPPSNHHLIVIWAVILVGYLKFLMPNRT